MSNRVSQLPVEVLIQSDVPVDLQLSQLPVEVLVLFGVVEARVTQDVIETLSLPVPAARVTQSVIEFLSTLIPPARVTQYVVEALSDATIPKDYTWQINDLPDVTRWMTGLLVFPEGDLDPPLVPGSVGAQVTIPMHVTTRVVFPVGTAGWGGDCLCDE